jgi:hypothetical protein
MNVFWLFLLVFFGIVGVVKTASVVYTFVIKSITFRKEDFVRIWTKQ